jgi:PAS domain S-box-containing protein
MTTFNDAYERIAGLTLEQVRGKTVREVWPETEQGWYDVYGEVARTGHPRSFEMFHKPTHGLYACNAYRPWDSPTRICVVFENVTERKRAEETLRESEELFRRLIEGAPDAIFVQTDNRFAYVDSACCNLFGARSADEIIGMQLMDRIHLAKGRRSGRAAGQSEAGT